MKICRWFLLILSLVLTGCISKQNTPIKTDHLNELKHLSMQSSPTSTVNDENLTAHIRIKALSDTAMSLGAQGGLSWASEQINTHLEENRWKLETTYNFNGMLLSHSVLPPVLVEGNNTLSLSDPTTLRIADKTYKIVEQARFATTPPNWRNYIWMQFKPPEIPNKVLLPRNSAEQKIWEDNIEEGWEKGIQQAYSIFQENLARLKRDYYGMILYRKLLQEKMVSAPYVSRTEMGVTGNGSDMNINDQILRITALPQLQTNSKRWQAIAVTEHVN